MPEKYQELVLALWAARESDEIVPLAETLVQNFWQLLGDKGIKVLNYQSVDDLPL